MTEFTEVPGLQPLRLLGVGGRSSVWLVRRTAAAEHTIRWASGDAPRILALKRPLNALRCAPSLRAAEQELQAMLPLAHEHLVRPWGLTRLQDRTTGLLMEPYTAGSMAQLLQATGMLSLGETVTALTPVAQALSHLHSRGAAHGDVTAANILLSPEGRPALADLGDSVLLGMDSHGGSPAQDVAALAAVAWQCLTGRQPQEIRSRIPLQALRPEIPEQTVQLLESALSPQSVERPAAGEFAAELYDSARPTPLNLHRHVDDAALTEMPTCLPDTQKPGPRRWWTGLLPPFGWFYRPN